MHVRYKSLYTSLLSSAKEQREMSRFCLVGETRTQTANFTYSFRIQRCHCIFSLCTVSEPLVNWTDLDNCEFPWQNRNSFLTRYCPGLSRRRCLSSLKTRRSWRHLTYWSYFFFTNISAILDPSIRPLRLNCSTIDQLGKRCWKDGEGRDQTKPSTKGSHDNPVSGNH